MGERWGGRCEGTTLEVDEANHRHDPGEADGLMPELDHPGKLPTARGLACRLTAGKYYLRAAHPLSGELRCGNQGATLCGSNPCLSNRFHGRADGGHDDAHAPFLLPSAKHHDTPLPTTQVRWSSRASDITMMFSLAARVRHMIQTVNRFKVENNGKSYLHDGIDIALNLRFLQGELVIQLFKIPQYRLLFAAQVIALLGLRLTECPA